MDSNVVKFPFSVSRRVHSRKPRQSGGRSRHTLLFRGYNLIVESGEADLVRDVSLELGKAETKLKAIRQQLKRTQELAAARVHLLTTAETKLTAAIVAALLSERGQR
jgi:hypothetical protein